MNKDLIERLKKEANTWKLPTSRFHSVPPIALLLDEAAAALSTAREDMKEECAKLCEQTYPEYSGPDKGVEQFLCFANAAECAAAIRQLGSK